VTTLAIVIAICVVVALCIFFWSRRRAAARRQAIRQYADENHYSFLGDRLPDTLHLDRSSFLRSAESISSAFTGRGKEKEFAFFDCSLREGRRGYIQSVLAIYRLNGHYPACQFDRQLREERAGDWTLIYHDRRTWPVPEIDAHVSSI
jgi:hypothetical protein